MTSSHDQQRHSSVDTQVSPEGNTELNPSEIYEKFLNGEYGRNMPYSLLFAYYRKRKKAGCCAYCGIELTGRKTVWCSNKCISDVTNGVRDWRVLREDVLKRDNYSCVMCGTTKDQAFLEVDHKIPFALDPSKHMDKENLRTLCKQCHIEKTKIDIKLIKQGKDQTRLTELNL